MDGFPLGSLIHKSFVVAKEPCDLFGIADRFWCLFLPVLQTQQNRILQQQPVKNMKHNPIHNLYIIKRSFGV
jgi:hypothetical protein